MWEAFRATCSPQTSIFLGTFQSKLSPRDRHWNLKLQIQRAFRTFLSPKSPRKEKTSFLLKSLARNFKLEMSSQDLPLYSFLDPCLPQALDASYTTILEDILSHYDDCAIPTYTEHIHNCSALSSLVQSNFRCCFKKIERHTEIRTIHHRHDRDNLLGARLQSRPLGGADSMPTMDVGTTVRECLRPHLRNLASADVLSNLYLADEILWRRDFSPNLTKPYPRITEIPA